MPASKANGSDDDILIAENRDRKVATDLLGHRFRSRKGGSSGFIGLKAVVNSRVAAAAVAVERSGHAVAAAETARAVEDRVRFANEEKFGVPCAGLADTQKQDMSQISMSGDSSGNNTRTEEAGVAKRREIKAAIDEARRARELREAEALRLDGERRRAAREAERGRRRQEFVLLEARRQHTAAEEARLARQAVEDERRARDYREAERKRNEFVEAAAQRQRAAEAELQARLKAEVSPLLETKYCFLNQIQMQMN